MRISENIYNPSAIPIKSIFNSMKKFLIDLFSQSDETSSKRVASLFVLVNLVIFTWIATISDINNITPQFMYDTLALIAGGGLGLTVIEKIFNKKDGDK